MPNIFNNLPELFVVSDASPLRYLILIKEVDLLRQIYGAIAIPKAVKDELSNARTPEPVRLWMASAPKWVTVLPEKHDTFAPFPELGAGERQAMAFALQNPKAIVLMDDLEARLAARSLGIQTVPTLRVLAIAAGMALVDFEVAVARLRSTNFRLSDKVLQQMRKTGL